ncbi:transposase [Acetobacterium paludosum]|nr:transposase [Acetobacterium paludosum]
MELQKRKRIRLEKYNYIQNGYYFITICTNDRKQVLCDKDCIIIEEDNSFVLSEIGDIVLMSIGNIEKSYSGVNIENYVIMPNHIHLLISINKNAETSISKIIQQTKGLVTRKAGFPVWQKSFYDHIIRNENDYYEIVRYIQMNPLKWQNDRYYLVGIE